MQRLTGTHVRRVKPVMPLAVAEEEQGCCACHALSFVLRTAALIAALAAGAVAAKNVRQVSDRQGGNCPLTMDLAAASGPAFGAALDCQFTFYGAVGALGMGSVLLLICMRNLCLNTFQWVATRQLSCRLCLLMPDILLARRALPVCPSASQRLRCARRIGPATWRPPAHRSAIPSPYSRRPHAGVGPRVQLFITTAILFLWLGIAGVVTVDLINVCDSVPGPNNTAAQVRRCPVRLGGRPKHARWLQLPLACPLPRASRHGHALCSAPALVVRPVSLTFARCLAGCPVVAWRQAASCEARITAAREACGNCFEDFHSELVQTRNAAWIAV